MPRGVEIHVPVEPRLLELEAAGGCRRDAPLHGPDALTPSELRVARLVAQGLTNREVAEVLFVTVKAVRFHLGSIYRKLDVADRGELARALDPRPGGR